MENTYTYRIVSLKKENAVYLNTVSSFVVEITASDGSNQISGEYEFYLEPPKTELFIEYQDLQEEDLISWFTSNHNESWIAKQDIDKKLRESVQDSVQSNFPWS